MKYLKITFAFFIATFFLASIGVNAQAIGLVNITIPVFKGSYISSQRDKYDTNIQYIKKIGCTDNVSGDGRVILAKVQGMTGGQTDSVWQEALPSTNVSFGNSSKTIGGWKLWLQSNKSLPTTANFSGTWTV